MSLIGDAKLDILLTLRESPSYGYELQDELGLNRGTVYVHLKELREAGMIEVDRVEDDTKYYCLTENGEQLLDALGE
ncbi:helix-turn-helix transcriptional regulator [Halorubrum sp. AD140]|uniref:PadR family transcriptional regulator n=1 Tax=Halorubrum sp. AD140 TaxID=3050073 RepID=UPI002ACCAD3F|nr:helix-turn-helix transcriptional regulator [Halorubrum sp. AD140]MDZ5810365.1 helix-turn-helix transcriptional regulator [Halorubrum sp. AD140]